MPEVAHVEVGYFFYSVRWADDFFGQQLARLPLVLQHKILRYRRWQDRQMGLIGKLLLRYGLSRKGDDNTLDNLMWTPQGRPYLVEGPDFNIAHSGGGVVCAIGDGGRIGIDLEHARKLNPSEFSLVMNCHEQGLIQSAADSSAALLRLWTFKESVAKAQGLGLGYDFKNIDSRYNPVDVDGQRFLATEISLAADYHCCLATESEAVNVTLYNGCDCLDDLYCQPVADSQNV